MRRVCVTGIGLVTPLGNQREESWRHLLAGKSAAGKISHFDASGWPIDIACEVKDFAINEAGVFEHQLPLLNRPAEFGMNAAWEAMSQSQLAGAVDPDRLGVMVGTGIGVIRPTEILSMLRHLEVTPGFGQVSAYIEQNPPDQSLLLKNHPSTFVAQLAERWDAQAFSKTLSTACTAGAQAIGYGYREIAEGRCDAALVGGADSLAGELLLAGFCLLGVLSKGTDSPTTASKPFDKNRDGFVAGEGAAMLVLEDLEHAQQRGATIIAEVLGYGESENAYRITDVPIDGHGAVRAMQNALRSGQLSPGDIDYINAHGTSTEQNDRVESLAIRKVFYDQGAQPYVTSNKSEIGHFIAASGAVEGAFSILSIRDNAIPPTINFENPNSDNDIKIVKGESVQQPVHRVLSNSFGFGGTNASLIFSEVQS